MTAAAAAAAAVTLRWRSTGVSFRQGILHPGLRCCSHLHLDCHKRYQTECIDVDRDDQLHHAHNRLLLAVRGGLRFVPGEDYMLKPSYAAQMSSARWYDARRPLHLLCRWTCRRRHPQLEPQRRSLSVTKMASPPCPTYLSIVSLYSPPHSHLQPHPPGAVLCSLRNASG